MTVAETPVAELLGALADYLCAFRDRVTEEFTRAVRLDERIPNSNKLTFHELADHMPALFDDLANRLRKHNITGPAPHAAEDARIHGRHRWKQGYDVTELLREIATVRQIILLSVLKDFEGQHPEFDGEIKIIAKRIVHEFFNNLVGNSVSQYVEDQQAEMAAANARLQESNVALQRVNTSRLLLTRNVSHEVRNIANALGGAIDVLATEAVDQEMIAICRRSIGDMQVLLQQLMDYSTLLARGNEVTISDCSLRDLCNEVTSTFDPVAQQNDVTLIADCGGDVIIRSDRRKLKQIAANLILNAIKYRNRSHAARVEFSCGAADADQWRMTVVDNGIGIDARDLGAIFDEFERGSAPDDVQGTGLGLTITKRLVELLGGRINVTSTQGKGTRFELVFPREIPAPPPAVATD